MEHAIDQIRRGSQYRRDPDEDLDELCGSLERVGILNPPAITEGSVLITGNRRLAAMERLGWRSTPVWVVPDVSDKLSYVLAIRDEQTLQKALKPLEQAELYEELKALYAEDAQRRDAATRFGSPDRDARVAEARDGGADSAPPSLTSATRSSRSGEPNRVAASRRCASSAYRAFSSSYSSACSRGLRAFCRVCSSRIART